MSKKDLKSAQEKMKEWIALRDNLIQASPYLDSIQRRLNWYDEAIEKMPHQEDKFLNLIELPVSSFLDLTLNELSEPTIHAATGSFYTASGETRQILYDERSSYYELYQGFEQLNKTDDTIDSILKQMSLFNDDFTKVNPSGNSKNLVQLFEDVKAAYSQWNLKAIDSSSFAKEIRSFQDAFNGCLNLARLRNDGLTKAEYKWNKMAKSLALNSKSNQNALIQLGSKEDDFHDKFTVVLKKTETISYDDMTILFKNYVDHLYSTISLIDIEKMK